ncbi:NEW3 domain-containing protein [Pseudoalteromonas sp. T1lg22]|uniref:NEW3 domain-containing protein n=1 Tax=Pseudoalteromonas sp. T1lg22 TaxID=2077096 RepID=UPI001F47070D|nr:NEW3 domain-containing protein [Pseudoalteromonas sp. T1lg22]
MTITKGVVTPNKLSSSVLKACGLGLLATTLGFTSMNLYAANGNGVQSAMQHDHQGRGHGQMFKQNKADIQAKKNQLEQQTLELAATMGELRRANKGANNSGKDKFSPAFEQQLEELVIARQASQYALLQLDANAAVRTVMPNAKRAGMPAHIEAKLAQQAELVGQLELVYEDSEDLSKNRLRHFLITDQGRVEMHLPANARSQKLQSGTKVKAKGWLFNGEDIDKITAIALDEQPETLMLSEDMGATSVTSSFSTTASRLPNTVGEQHTLVLLVNFQDNPQQPWTQDEVRQKIFGTVNDYYKEVSYGKTSLAGDVKGYYTLPIAQTCDYFDMETYIKDAAAADGVNTADYDRIIYLYPKVQCGWSGMGTVGGLPSRAWINGNLTLNTIGHEFGHNLGLHHAKAIDCGENVLGESCVVDTYGDFLDIMGNKTNGHLNAFNKERLGWLSAESGEIVVAGSNNSYQLTPLETHTLGTTKALKIRRGTDSTTGASMWFYLEYRQPIGFDFFIEGNKGITDGAIVHTATDGDPRSGQQLDMTPDSVPNDLYDAALPIGTSYTDPEFGITFSADSIDAAGLNINVGSVAATCVSSAPGVSIANQSEWGAPGSTVSYSATVTNNDNLECNTSQFDVAAQVPAGWSATSDKVSLAPGASATVTLNVTSSSNAEDGFYDININAANSEDSQYSASTMVSYVVEAPVAACVSANPQWTLQNTSSTQVAAGTTVTYQGTITNKDTDSCAASTFDVKASLPAGWKATSPSATLAPGQSQTLSVSVTSAADANAGVYDFSLVALNRNNGGYQSSASATYEVAAPVASCKLAAPKLSVADALGSEVDAGTVQRYSVEITNQNQDCGDATYNLSIATPSGWSASNNTVTLASGATTTVSVSVMSATSANAGSYNLTLTAKDVANTAYSSTSTLVYRVAQPQNNAPVANSDSATLTSKTAIYINVLGNDKDIDGDTLVVKSATQGAKGSVQVLSDGRIIYTPAKNFKSSDSFSYTISDGQLQSTATVNVTLASDGGNGGNKGKGNSK